MCVCVASANKMKKKNNNDDDDDDYVLCVCVGYVKKKIVNEGHTQIHKNVYKKRKACFFFLLDFCK